MESRNRNWVFKKKSSTSSIIMEDGIGENAVPFLHLVIGVEGIVNSESEAEGHS